MNEWVPIKVVQFIKSKIKFLLLKLIVFLISICIFSDNITSLSCTDGNLTVESTIFDGKPKPLGISAS